MILRIEKEKHILKSPETGVTVCWSWMSGPSLTHAVRPSGLSSEPGQLHSISAHWRF